MQPRPKALLLLPHLGTGGAARVLSLLAQGLSREKYELHLGLLISREVDRNRLPSDLTVHRLSARRVRGATLGLLRLVRLLKPDVILSGMAHLNFLVLLLRPLFPRRTAVLARQTGTVSATLAFDKVPCYTRLLYRVLYRHADGVICQSDAMAEDMITELSLSPRRIAVLPNPVDVDGIRHAVAASANQWTGDGPHLIAVGRLAREKGFDLLLTALACVREQFPCADLLIAGTGSQESALRAERHLLQLDHAVRFAGQVEHPYLHFSGAAVFVLSSRYEGMPNALLEAAAAGLPLVATPACGGICELLRGQSGVWLAETITADALAAAILEALGALQPQQRFRHQFVEKFSMEQVIRSYERLIDATLEALRA